MLVKHFVPEVNPDLIPVSPAIPDTIGLDDQIKGEGIYQRVGGTAWHACLHVRAKIAALLKPIEKGTGQMTRFEIKRHKVTARRIMRWRRTAKRRGLCRTRQFWPTR